MRCSVLPVAVAAGLVGVQFSSTASAAIIVPVGNASFETDGGFIAGVGITAANANWWNLPSGGAWVDGNAGSPYDILDLAKESYHFPALLVAPEGIRVANVGAVSPLSQELSFAIGVGDTISLSLWLGDSVNATPRDVNVTFTLNGSNASPALLVTNTAPDGGFVQKSVLWTATSAGSLGVKLAATGTGSAVYIDDVNVSVEQVPEPASLALISLVGLAAARRRRA